VPFLLVLLLKSRRDF
ncbi:hypothetical protein, partial [Duodenibacillus massiliensis]